MSATPEQSTAGGERLALARAFEKVNITTGVGISLGMWAGRGDWAQTSQESRNRAGQRALQELDQLISQLATFRGDLADALG